MVHDEAGTASEFATDEHTFWLARVEDPRDEARSRGAPGRTVCMRGEGGQVPGPDAELWEVQPPLGYRAGGPDHLYGRVLEGAPIEGGLCGRLGDYRLLPPLRSRKVIGIGRNYRAHAEELGNEVPTTPLSFFKSPTCLLASGEAIELPPGYDRIDMESELVVVIGRRGRHVRASRAWEYVGGYTLGNDVSNRDLQRADKQWTRAKGFDTFGPCGPFVRLTPPGFEPPLERMTIRGYLNDQLVQEGACSMMIFDIPTLIEHLSEAMTLEVGDLIYTGTPAGVSALGAGSIVRIELEGFELGRLTNPVVRAPEKADARYLD
jgi:2-keto-4-pentenoate hydratase/2-oxohepta-3-ene-1,7-dioic acid hydratase in catechol pathway